MYYRWMKTAETQPLLTKIVAGAVQNISTLADQGWREWDTGSEAILTEKILSCQIKKKSF